MVSLSPASSNKKMTVLPSMMKENDLHGLSIQSNWISPTFWIAQIFIGGGITAQKIQENDKTVDIDKDYFIHQKRKKIKNSNNKYRIRNQNLCLNE